MPGLIPPRACLPLDAPSDAPWKKKKKDLLVLVDGCGRLRCRMPKAKAKQSSAQPISHKVLKLSGVLACFSIISCAVQGKQSAPGDRPEVCLHYKCKQCNVAGYPRSKCKSNEITKNARYVRTHARCMNSYTHARTPTGTSRVRM